MNFGEAVIFVAGMIVLTAHYRQRLFGHEADYDRRWLITWMVKGMALPAIAWMALNVGRRPIVPALVPMLSPANTGSFGQFTFELNYLAAQAGPALYAISSYWAALTLGWMLKVAASREEAPDGFARVCLTWGVLVLPLIALLSYAGGLGTLGLAGLVWTWPLAHFFLATKPVVTAPMYAGAIAKMKFGKYREAEKAIISQLEKCETDFDGWLMLAQLYATQFHDLSEAERTIHDLCNEPTATPSQVAIALNLLADWQLQLRGDPEAAGRALEEISRRLPGSHLARMAALRRHQLPATAAAWQEQQRPKTVHLPPLSDQLDNHGTGDTTKLGRSEALALVNQCTEKLQLDPNDVEVREQLAVTLAGQLGEIDLGIEQLDSLIEMPEQSPKKIAEWLALMAAWEIRRGTNPAAARNFLNRLVREHPDSVEAFAAQRRLNLLDAESRMAQISATGGAKVAADNPG